MDGGRWTVDGGRWNMDGGRWTVDGGRWTVDNGRWTMDGGRWTVDGGRWTVDGGWWMVDGGRWTVDGGRWTVDGGWWTARRLAVDGRRITGSSGSTCKRRKNSILRRESDKPIRTAVSLPDCREVTAQLDTSPLAGVRYLTKYAGFTGTYTAACHWQAHVWAAARRGVVLRIFLVGLTGFAGPLHVPHLTLCSYFGSSVQI